MTEKRRPSPLLESPRSDAASSSDDEEQLEDVVVEEGEGEEEVKVKGGENEEDIKEEAKEEEEEEEDDDDSTKFSVKKHVVVVVPSPQPPQSSSSSSSMGEEEEEESDSESSAGSDSDHLPVPPPPPPEKNTKSSNNTDVEKPPITSIPMAMEAGINAKQQQQLKKKSCTDQKPKANSTVVTPTTKQLPRKRAASEADNKPEEEEEEEEEVSKRRNKKKKKKNGGHDREESEMMMKSPATKVVWSKADEVVILDGMLSLTIKKQGTEKPTSEMINELHENIKASLHAQATNDQLYGKIRKLKQKYSNGKMDDSKIYELAKKVWGTSVKEDFKLGENTTDEAINDTGVDSAAAKKEGKSTIRRSHRRKATNTVVSLQQQQQQQLRNEVLSTEQSRPLPSFFNEVIESVKNSIVPPEGLKRFLAKEVLGFIEGSKAKDLEDKWKKLQIAEARIFLERIDLVKEHVELVLDAFGTEE